jgi:H+/Cl- antiporter ClcA
MSLGLRRVLVLVLAVIGGVAGVYVIFALLNAVYNARVDFERYGATYFVLTALPLGLLVGLWMDYFLRAGIIPEVKEPEAQPEKRGRASEE